MEMEFKLGAVIAERILTAINADRSESEVSVRLGTPGRIPDSRGVYAPYQIEYCGKTRTWYAAGMDGFQALQLAIKMIAVELDSLRRVYGVELALHGDADTGLSF